MKTNKPMMGEGGRHAPYQAQSAKVKPPSRSVQVLETQWACAGSVRTTRWVLPNAPGPKRPAGV
jgi:hypothetical protein